MPTFKVLLVGESWMTHSVHHKGFDSFTTTEYVEGAGPLIAALEKSGIEVDYQPSHVAMTRFPDSAQALKAWDCVILSDIGSNSLLLHPDTFVRSESRPNRLEAIAEYVLAGGGLIMIGGYLTFQGIEAKGKWRGTPVEGVLPVTLQVGDDRREQPQGVVPAPTGAHEVLDSIEGAWPAVLGYNQVEARPEAEVLVNVGDDPLIVVGKAGSGRSAVFTSDCAPHWAPPAFMSWEHYDRLWAQLVTWACRAEVG